MKSTLIHTVQGRVTVSPATARNAFDKLISLLCYFLQHVLVSVSWCSIKLEMFTARAMHHDHKMICIKSSLWKFLTLLPIMNYKWIIIIRIQHNLFCNIYFQCNLSQWLGYYLIIVLCNAYYDDITVAETYEVV